MLFATLIPLAAVGFLISSYFTAISYRWIKPDVKWIPSFCRMEERTCASIVFTPRARVFGLPNSILGQVFYLALMAGVWSNFALTPPVYYLLVCASLLTVLLGLFLTYSLLFLTRVPCKLCFTSHAINLIIFILLVIEA